MEYCDLSSIGVPTKPCENSKGNEYSSRLYVDFNSIIVEMLVLVGWLHHLCAIDGVVF